MALEVIEADMLAALPRLAADGVRYHAVVTDPPYELAFMGRKWDASGISFRPETWRAVYDVMLPGAWLVAMGGTRTYHRMACAIEDAGFEIRDCLMFLYGSGFPKSLDVSKAIDRMTGAEREVVGKMPFPGGTNPRRAMGDGWQEAPDITAPATSEAAAWAGWGTALKPAFEPIVLARKPCVGTVAANLLRHGCGALNIDASRVAGVKPDTVRGGHRQQDGYGMLGQGAILDDGKGRYPANVLHDGSPDVLDAFAAFGSDHVSGGRRVGNSKMFGVKAQPEVVTGFGDTGTAARFFYSAKADAADRADSRHPTVKPVDLIRYLVTLVTPKRGRVLDPFAGSGTTGEACMLLGFDCTMIERDATHAADIRHRIRRWSGLDAPLFADAAN